MKFDNSYVKSLVRRGAFLGTISAIATAPLFHGCGLEEMAESEPKYAVFNKASVAGGTLGRIIFMENGYSTDWKKYRVCIQNDLAKPGTSSVTPSLNNVVNERYSEYDLLLETKAAFLMWLRGSVQHGDTWLEKVRVRWNRFSFFLSNDCSKEKGILSKVAVSRLNNDKSSAARVYKEIAIHCKTESSKRSCKASGLIMGLGSTGGYGYRYLPSKPEKYTSISVGNPSHATLSPYVEWLPLADEIRAQKKLSSQVRAEMLALLKEIPQANGDEEFSKLMRLVELIADVKMTGIGDPEFASLARKYFSARRVEPSMEKSYRPKKAAFHTLVHEVGHMFGMDHADDPNEKSVVGRVDGAPDGETTTKLAAMAYGDDFLYLTEDDLAGVLFINEHLKDFMEAHK